MVDRYDSLRLENQLCFRLYASAKEVVRRYGPLLDELDLTYTQYLVMMVLWEHDELTVSELGEDLLLDSGTLTPLLKKLEAKGYVSRHRAAVDERRVLVKATDEGMKLRDRALNVPFEISKCVNLEQDDIAELRDLLDRLLANMKEDER
jgi:DNA-binding MarR family transcriptional regulator